MMMMIELSLMKIACVVKEPRMKRMKRKKKLMKKVQMVNEKEQSTGLYAGQQQPNTTSSEAAGR